ncbi:MAG: VTT domain-containing protein [Rubrivivax sp.]
MIGIVLDWVLHLDEHLLDLFADHGLWAYLAVFATIFAETGLVVAPFLPGDSLLFVTGALAGAGLVSYPLAVGVLVAAAIAGNQTNYTIGRAVGPRVFGWEQSRWFNRRAFDQAHAFYERWCGITIVLARFMPFARTFAPFVAGVAQMTRSRFSLYDVTGGVLWVGSIVSAGYLFGNVPWVSANLSLIIWGFILVPGVIALAGAWRARRRAADAA